MIFNLLLFGAILLTNFVNANVNITCYECSSCTSTPATVSTNNRLCFRVQVNCIAADIHIIDLMGDRLHLNHSLANCGQTRSYSSTCTIEYQCCYANQCNTFESPIESPSSSSSSLFIFNKIVISFNILLLYHRCLR